MTKAEKNERSRLAQERIARRKAARGGKSRAQVAAQRPATVPVEPVIQSKTEAVLAEINARIAAREARWRAEHAAEVGLRKARRLRNAG